MKVAGIFFWARAGARGDGLHEFASRRVLAPCQGVL